MLLKNYRGRKLAAVLLLTVLVALAAIIAFPDPLAPVWNFFIPETCSRLVTGVDYK